MKKPAPVLVVIICVSLFALSVGLLTLWHSRPSILTCVLFWATAFSSTCCLAYVSRNIGHLIMAFGSLSNAIVTIANGGFMPVLVPLKYPDSVWVKATDSHQLLFLADRLFGVGASVGDVLLGVGLLASGVVLTVRMMKAGKP